MSIRTAISIVVGVKQSTHFSIFLFFLNGMRESDAQMKVKGHEVRNEAQLLSTLDEIYHTSKHNNEPFYNLVELMCNEQTIITAIHNIKSNKGSKTAGIDAKDVNYYLQMEKGKLVKLIHEAIANYNPQPVRRVYIPKANGDKRPLGIPTMLDRIVQELARIVLEPIAEGKFFGHSYGFRPYRGADHAIARMIDLINRHNYYYAIEGDIKGFFDNINHNKLIEIMWSMGIKDKRYLSIIKKMLKAGIMEENKTYTSELGTPQGGIISPILANIYLNGFDWLIANMWETHPTAVERMQPKNKGRFLRQHNHQPCWLIRYADDWIILCDSRENAERVLTKADKYFKHVLHLELSKEKTLITDVREIPAKFLGFEIVAEKARMKDKIVGKAIPNRKKLYQKVDEVAKEINKLKLFKNDYDRAAHIELINSKIVGISNYYKIGNCTFLFKKADWRLDNRAYKTFTKMYGDKDWTKLRKPAKELDNRRDRHTKKGTQVYFVRVDDVDIGLTRLSFTPSTKALNFNQHMTPYTKFGRELYEAKIGKKLKLARPTVYNPEDLAYIALHQLVPKRVSDRLYNFEFIMNREYAYNRDKGQCKACKNPVTGHTIQCHHIRPYLPPDEVNKVANLATLCKHCHKAVHNDNIIISDAKITKRVEKYRDLLKDKSDETNTQKA